MAAVRFGDFLDDYKDCFSHTFDKSFNSITSYITGLLSETRRKNIERVAECQPQSNYQSIQYCISEADWDYRILIDRIAKNANALFSSSEDTALLIDESAFAKKGDHSVGVQRQWNGRLGKTDNCQVAVFAALSSKASVCPIDMRLFLPKSWTSNPERCEKAGIPEEERIRRSKIDLAWEMISDAKEKGIDFKWVGMDSFYGRSRSLLAKIEDAGMEFVADVPENTMVILPGSNEKISVKKLAEKRRYTRHRLRPQTKGYLTVDAMSVTIEMPMKGKEDTTRKWRLIVTKDLATNEIKYSLTNSKKPVKRLAYMQRQRFWVERAFQDGKTSCGMAQYQVRGWKAWHHHMALVMLAMLFLLTERILQNPQLPLLSCQDIVSVLDAALVQKQFNVDNRIEATRLRHQQRFRDIQRRQRCRGPGTKYPILTK